MKRAGLNGRPRPRLRAFEHPDRNTALLKWLTTAAMVLCALARLLRSSTDYRSASTVAQKAGSKAGFSPPSPLAATDIRRRDHISNLFTGG